MSKTNSFFKHKKMTSLIIVFTLTLLYLAQIIPSINNSIQSIEYELIDMRFSQFQNKATNPNIIIIDIDPSSIKKLNQWPWPRKYWKTALQNLLDLNPSVIGVDVLFDNPSQNKFDDESLGNLIRNNPNIVLTSEKFTEKRASYEIETWAKPIPNLAYKNQFGFTNYPVDSDGKVRKAFTQLSSHLNSPPQPFNQLIVAKHLKKKPNAYIQRIQKIYADDTTNTFLVDFTLNNSFTHIPFFLLFENRLPKPEIIKNSIVLIGATDPALNDYHYTPIGPIPGVTLVAHSISTLLEESFINILSPIWSYIIIGCLLNLIVIITLNKKGLAGFLVTIGIIIIYSVIALLCFKHFKLLIPWALFIAGSIITYALSLIIKLLQEEKEKTYIHSIFNQYVSPQVVSKLINSPDALNLGGEKKELTIFFSDIRSFTTLCEEFTPEVIIKQLNEYLNTMTAIIFKWQGTIDKYIGDEIMAIWGAPIEDKNHAKNALFCAWEQLTELKKLQEKWKKDKKPIFDIGIGINTGNVIVGNIGSKKKKDYTVIGDPVNVASRLENLTRIFSTKNHICRLIISESTYKKCKSICDATELKTTQIKGKKQSILAYEVTHVSLPKNDFPSS